jgi:hypothetical protein
MTKDELRNKLAFIHHYELERCIENIDNFSDLAWEIASRIAEDDIKTPLFNKVTHVWIGESDEQYEGFISVWPCFPDRFIMVRDRGAQVSLTYRKSFFVPADWDELYGDSPYMDWGLFSNADDALRAFKDKSLWDAGCGWGVGRGAGAAGAGTTPAGSSPITDEDIPF